MSWIVRGYAQWVTDRAALIDVSGTGDQRWIPLSQIRDVVEGTLDASAINRVRRASDDSYDGRGTSMAYGYGTSIVLTIGKGESGLGAQNHHDYPVVLSVNPWWVKKEGLPHEKPKRQRRGGAA